jgi:hypothetical protein
MNWSSSGPRSVWQSMVPRLLAAAGDRRGFGTGRFETLPWLASVSTFLAAASQNSSVLNARIKTLGRSWMVLNDNRTRMYPEALISREPYGRDLSLTFGEKAVSGHPGFHGGERSRSKIV